MTVNEWLKKENKKVAWLARRLEVRHCVARRWAAGEAVPSPKYMPKVVEVTNGEVQPNDFYEVK